MNRHVYNRAFQASQSARNHLSPLSRGDHTRTVLTLRLGLYNQLKCEFLVKTIMLSFLLGYVTERQNIYACADEMCEQERKTQHLQTWRWSVVPNESSRDFGPCDRFWTQLALRCFLLPTSPPGTALMERYIGP